MRRSTPRAPTEMSGPVFIEEKMIPAALDWMKYFAFHHDGAVYEYAAPVASSDMTEQQAEDRAYYLRAREHVERKFLHDVELKEKH